MKKHVGSLSFDFVRLQRDTCWRKVVELFPPRPFERGAAKEVYYKKGWRQGSRLTGAEKNVRRSLLLI